MNEAYTMKKDIVLRNAKIDPPIVKITNYRKDLLKKLFTKLGSGAPQQQKSKKENKVKAVHLTTTITVHDLENKKRKSIEFLKSYTTLKFFMKVNTFDDANIQKGRLMLLNIAEDLKEYAKVKVSPGNNEAKEPEIKSEKKPKTVDDVAKKAKQQMFVNAETIKKTELIDDYDKEFYEQTEDKPQYLYMELESTAAFKNVDIDAMLEHTSIEQFMHGLYTAQQKLGIARSGKQESVFDLFANKE